MNANIRPTFLTSQRRFLLLIATMAVVAVAVAGATQFVLYQAAFEGQRQRLI